MNDTLSTPSNWTEDDWETLREIVPDGISVGTVSGTSSEFKFSTSGGTMPEFIKQIGDLQRALKSNGIEIERTTVSGGYNGGIGAEILIYIKVANG